MSNIDTHVHVQELLTYMQTLPVAEEPMGHQGHVSSQNLQHPHCAPQKILH